MTAKEWIEGDESAKEMLARVSSERPVLLLPPLHRVPLRLGNVVEIVGPSPSAKTDILIQAAVSCILPKEWNGVQYGGLEQLAMFIDLDCRFDILRLSQALKHRIMEVYGSDIENLEENRGDKWNHSGKNDPNTVYDEKLYAVCMRRFLYVRCYDSLEFLSTLKTLRGQLQRQGEAHGATVRFLLIDSIGAFHWVDRALTCVSLGGNKRKLLSFQMVSETVVQEIRKLLVLQSMLVLATKSIILGDACSMNASKRKWSSPESLDKSGTGGSQRLSYREYMPAVWQSFVTHRILVGASDDEPADIRLQSDSIFSLKWELPSLNFLDKFIVRDGGIFIFS